MIRDDSAVSIRLRDVSAEVSMILSSSQRFIISELSRPGIGLENSVPVTTRPSHLGLGRVLKLMVLLLEFQATLEERISLRQIGKNMLVGFSSFLEYKTSTEAQVTALLKRIKLCLDGNLHQVTVELILS